jgi:hypothetical protein
MNGPSQYMSGIAGQTQNQANSILAQLGPLLSAFTKGINLPQINAQTMGYLTNPNATNLAQAYPTISNVFKNMATQGLDPRVMNAAFNQNQVQGQQSINNLRSQLGAALPNLAGAVGNLGFSNAEGRAQLGSELAAQNQGVQAQGAQGLQQAAGGLDAQTMQMLTSAFGLGQGAQQNAVNPLTNIYGIEQNLAGQEGMQAGQMMLQEPNLFSGILGGLEGLGSMYMTGGMSGLFGGGQQNSAGGGGLGFLNNFPVWP